MAYKKLFEKDINEIIGYLKSKYKSLSQVKQSQEFKKLSQSDKEYVLDELKSEGFK